MLKQGLKKQAVIMTPVLFIITGITTLFGRSKSLNTTAHMYFLLASRQFRQRL